MSAALVWMIAAIVAVGVEIFTVDLTFGLIAVGLGSAGVAAAVGAPLWLQAVIGVGVSAAGLLFIRPIALRHMRKAAVGARTGVDALPGVSVKHVANHHRGAIPVSLQLWHLQLPIKSGLADGNGDV